MEYPRPSDYPPHQSISLAPDQEAWINAHVARRDFPSVADAARQPIDDRMAEEGDDLA